MREFSLWLFGNAETTPLVNDSRQIDRFARVLASDAALDYLRSVRRPSLEKAFVIAGGGEEEVFDLLATATYNVQEALSSLHLYQKDDRVRNISIRLLANTEQVKKTLDL